MGAGERDLTAVLIGACVGSMTVLVFTIGILAFIYWCCFRERLRWWRKFENAAVVLGAPSQIKSRVSSNKPSDVQSPSLQGVTTISGNIQQHQQQHQKQYQANYQGHQTNGEIVTDFRMSAYQQTGLTSAMKGSHMHTSQILEKRPAPKPRLTRVRPGVSLAALPTSKEMAASQFYQSQQQPNLIVNRNGRSLVRRISQQGANKSALKQRGVSVPETAVEEHHKSQHIPLQSTMSSNSSSTLARSAKKWTSMPAITAFGDFVTREREKIVQKTQSRKLQLTEEVSSSWRIHGQSRGPTLTLEPTPQSPTSLDDELTEQNETKTLNFGHDDTPTPDVSVRRTGKKTPPPSVKAVIKMPNASSEYGSHSSRSGDDSAIMVMDSEQSTSSSKNGTDIEQLTSPQQEGVETVLKSSLKKPTYAKEKPVDDEMVQSAMVGVKVDDMATNSMRSKIAKIRRYKQRSRTTSVNNQQMVTMRSLSVAELTTKPIQPSIKEEQRPKISVKKIESGVYIPATNVKGTNHQGSSMGPGHTIHVDAVDSPAMKRYATLEALSGESAGSFVGRVAASMSNSSEQSQICTMPRRHELSSSSSSHQQSPAQGVRLIVGGSQSAIRASLNNKHLPRRNEISSTSGSSTTQHQLQQSQKSPAQRPAAMIYSPTAASYNVEQATRQHHQQQYVVKNGMLTVDDGDDNMSFTADQGKFVNFALLINCFKK